MRAEGEWDQDGGKTNVRVYYQGPAMSIWESPPRRQDASHSSPVKRQENFSTNIDPPAPSPQWPRAPHRSVDVTPLRICPTRPCKPL